MRFTPAIFDVASNISRIALLCVPKTINSTFLASGLIALALISHDENAYADGNATHDALVSEFPSFNTPGIVDGRVEAIAIDGDTVYVGGTFTQIYNPLDEDNVINQPYLFAYSKSTGNVIETFDPQVNNTVFALETTGDATGGVFAGGVFGNLNGQFSRGRLAKIDINGDRVPSFGARANGGVKAMVRRGNTLYVGGNFDAISSTPIERLAALDTSTGAVSPNLNLDFGGVITTSVVTSSKAVQGVKDLDVTSDGKTMVIAGNFQTIDGIARRRFALIELEGQAQVSDWYTDVFEVQCPVARLPVYIQGLDISPDDQYVLVATNGYRFIGDPACDSITRFEIDDLGNTDVQPTWINWTGGDSVYEVLATGHAVYVGGHFRWLNNDTTQSGDAKGAGSIDRAGFALLDPRNGLTMTEWQSDRNPRGVGVFAMEATADGIYFGDDTDFMNGSKHAKLKFMPLTSDVITRPVEPTLPTTLVRDVSDDLDGFSFDGSNFGSTTELHGSNWSDARGAVYAEGKLFHVDRFDRIWMSAFDNGVFQNPTQVNLYGLTDDEWNISQIGGMFFDYEYGRLYYTLRNDSRLFYRGFTPASPYFGNDRFVADVQADIPWSDVTGMDVVDGFLYFSRTNDRLYRAEINNGRDVVSDTIQQFSGSGIDNLSWNNDLLAFLSDDMVEPTETELVFNSFGTDTISRFQQFEFPVTSGEDTTLRLDWTDTNSDLALFVKNPNGQSVAFDNSTAGSPKWLTVPAGAGGTYTASVLIRSGSTSYTLTVNPDVEPPAPRADFDFTSSGTDTTGKWQVFDLDINAGELIEAEVIWDDPTADVRVFLRDETGSLVISDTDGGLPATLSTIANSSGTWTIAVRIVSGSVNYDVLVNTTTDFEPPSADFVFASSGSPTSGKWQVFRFDVVAGEDIDAEISWDDPNADVRVFLRNENGTAITNDTDGGLPATLSATAGSTGQWSIGVSIVSGTVNYDVLVNTD